VLMTRVADGKLADLWRSDDTKVRDRAKVATGEAGSARQARRAGGAAGRNELQIAAFVLD